MIARLRCWLAALAFTQIAAAAMPTETIVFIRHGEKPSAGLGQLNCQGLNRALALPAILGRDFGRPDAIFAPDPAIVKPDHGKPYDYVRPLATIEPTAIAFALPVNASIGYSDVAGLQLALEAPPLRHATVLVAWEHTELVAVVRALASAHHGDPSKVPDWKKDDYDSIYVLRIAPNSASFERQAEGANGLSPLCPK